MRYRITGTDEKSRAPIELILEAASEAAAWKDASSRGVIVRAVEAAERAAAPTSIAAGPEPLTVRIEPGHVQLIELTHKRWKSVLVVSLLLVVAGAGLAGWLVLRDPRVIDRPPMLLWGGAGLFVLGLAGLVIGRVGAWWYHG